MVANSLESYLVQSPNVGDSGVHRPGLGEESSEVDVEEGGLGRQCVGVSDGAVVGGCQVLLASNSAMASTGSDDSCCCGGCCTYRGGSIAIGLIEFAFSALFIAGAVLSYHKNEDTTSLVLNLIFPVMSAIGALCILFAVFLRGCARAIWVFIILTVVKNVIMLGIVAFQIYLMVEEFGDKEKPWKREHGIIRAVMSSFYVFAAVVDGYFIYVAYRAMSNLTVERQVVTTVTA
uniref:MARVEL domain-containing protein n=1 Tax=Steinernema glaseri TaxID=37863 RepID=A0A1I8A0S2_9BILA